MGGSIRRHRRTNYSSKVRVGLKKENKKDKVVAIGEHTAVIAAYDRTLLENYAGARLAVHVNGPAGVPKGAHGRVPTTEAPSLADGELEPDHVFGEAADEVTRRELDAILGRNQGEHGAGRSLAPLTSRQKRVVAALVEKHGANFAAMARDIKLNVMQHPEGKLRKLVLSFHAFKDKTLSIGASRPNKRQLTSMPKM